MKKRLLGLALALVMIISLLPATTFAAVPDKVNIKLYNDATGNDALWQMTKSVGARYFVLENYDVAGVTYTKAVKEAATATPGDNYISVQYTTVDTVSTLKITLKNFNYKRDHARTAGFFEAGTTGEYDIIVNLEGENSVSGDNAFFQFANTGKLTFTGSGSLEINSKVPQAKPLILKSKAGDLTIKDTKLVLNSLNPDNTGARHGITVNGNIILDGAEIEADIYRGALFRTSDCSSSSYSLLDAAAASVTITDSTVDASNSVGSYQLISSNGTAKITNSNVKMVTNAASPATVVPSIEGAYSTKIYSKSADGSNPQAWDLSAGGTMNSSIRYMELVVKTCNHSALKQEDCTRAVVCEVCNQTIFTAKAAHVAGQDDGDCTTDILCSNPGCTQVATEGAEKHKDTRTDCGVAGTCANTGCQHAFAAGQHNPEADDGDCTTAIKCATCGKEVKAGESAHKYTDKKDTTCDNAGCQNTRKVESGTTENPKTGDNTALVLCLSLMLAASAAFVCTKKFAR